MDIFNNGEKVYLKGKYGMFYGVTINKISGEYAFVKGDDFTIGNQKVKLENLYREPSETFKRESKELQKKISKAQEDLLKIKDREIL